MLRARIQQGLRASASGAAAAAAAAFHTTPPALETRRARLARAARKDNIEKRAERARTAALARPDPVLGHAPGNDAKWHACELARILVAQRALQAPAHAAPPLDAAAAPALPAAFQWGIGGDPAAQQLLFDSLPDVTSQLALQPYDVRHPHDPLHQSALYKGQLQQLHNVHQLSRLADLRNASAAGIAFENRRRCVAAFSEPGKPNDTGRPEVQAALLTMKIRKLSEHLQRNRKDVANRRSLRMLVHQRAKVLKYLKRLDRQRFELALDRLGLEAGAIEGELVV